MGKKTVTQVEEAQKDPSRMNPRRNMPRHTVITNIYIYIKATSNIQGNLHKTIG